MIVLLRRSFSTYTIKDMPIRIAGIVRESIVDGPDLRFVVFTQGCPHKCEGCHNPETHDFSGGFATTTAKIWAEIEKNPMIKGVTFSGGEPFCQAEALAELGRAAKENGLHVMTYSGFTFDALLKKADEDRGVRELLTVTNYLVDGPFVLSQRDLSLKYRGSRNQRVLDITCYPNSTDVQELYKVTD